MIDTSRVTVSGVAVTRLNQIKLYRRKLLDYTLEIEIKSGREVVTRGEITTAVGGYKQEQAFTHLGTNRPLDYFQLVCCVLPCTDLPIFDRSNVLCNKRRTHRHLKLLCMP